MYKKEKTIKQFRIRRKTTTASERVSPNATTKHMNFDSTDNRDQGGINPSTGTFSNKQDFYNLDIVENPRIVKPHTNKNMGGDLTTVGVQFADIKPVKKI